MLVTFLMNPQDVPDLSSENVLLISNDFLIFYKKKIKKISFVL